MTDKSELPTAARLNELRLEGKVPISAYSIRALSTLAFALSLLAEKENFLKVVRLVSRADPSVMQHDEVVRLLGAITHLLMVPAFVAAVVIFAVGMMQTKLFFQPGLLALAFARCWVGCKFRSAQLVSSFVCFVCICGLSLLVFIIFSRDIWGLMFYTPEQLVRWVVSATGSIIALLSLYTVLTAICAIFFAQLIFRLKHLMSKREVELEGE